MIEREVKDFDERNYRKRIQQIDNKFGLNLKDCPISQPDVVEVLETRNLLVHSKGQVDRRYIQTVKNPNLQIGEKRTINNKYLQNAFDIIFLSVEYMDRTIIHKFPPE